MSFTQELNRIVNNGIQQYASLIAEKYNVSEDDLLELWNSTFSEEKIVEKKKTVASKTVKKSPSEKKSSSPSVLDNLTKTELANLCKAKNLKVSGTKQEIIDRLNESESARGVSEEKPQAVDVAKKSSSSKPEKKIIEKIKTQVEQNNITVRKNCFGHFENPQTRFVFDNKTKKVFGKQNDNGQVDLLTDEDIETCKRYKFTYEIPENLDSKKGFDVKVDELDEDALEDADVEEEEIDEEDEFVDEDEFVEEEEEYDEQ